MLIKYILLIIVSMQIYASNTLNNVYYLDQNTVQLSNIIPSSDSDVILFKIENGRHSKKVNSKELIKILKKHGYENYAYKNRYINFIKKSPIDTSKIKSKIKEHYKQNYDQIDIHSITVEPRSYLSKLPDKYTVEIRSRNYLSRDGTISIKTPSRKKIFFDYIIDANVDIYISRKKIKKNTELSAINSSKKSIILDKFRAKPIQIINKSTLQSKHHISKDKTLTVRDVETLSIVKKGSYLNISLNNNNIDITFSAKALEDGRINEIINVVKPNGKRLKARVIGKNRAEIK